MKKFLSILMVLTLVLSLGISAFAAENNGSITINNATIGETYRIYRVFDATYNSDGDVTYTIKSSDPFFALLFGADGNTPNEFFTYHKSTGVVTKNAGVSDADLFAYLKGLIATVAPTASKEAEDVTVVFDTLTTGYYVIDREKPDASAVTITTAKPHAVVNDKNLYPGGDLDKTSDKDSASVGDTIHWTVTFTATNYDDGNKIEYYSITDTLTPAGWAAIDTSSIQIKIDGTVVANWTLVSGDANGFEINLPWIDSDGEFIYDPSVSVVITYSAVVLDAAIANDPTAKENKNKVELEWNGGGIDAPGVGDVAVFNMGFTKVDGTDTTKTLPGAIFELYVDEECLYPVYVKAGSAEGVYIVENGGTNTQMVTPASGQIIIQGLEGGTYYLKEIKAPDGYNLLTSTMEVEVGSGDSDEMVVNSVSYTVSNAELTIKNNSGVELPSTGGEGTFWLITIGTLMAIGFAVFLITHKKMSIYTD